MSTAAAKKNNQNLPALATTGRGAAVYVTLGIASLTMGFLWIISLLAAAPGSKGVLFQLSAMVKGLGGKLYYGLPALCIWAGAQLLVSCRHRVSVRNFLIVTAVYWLLLAGFTLIARVTERGGPSLTYLEYLNRYYSAFDLNGYLQGAYKNGATGTGGLLGVLIAYPLSKTITRIGAILLICAALIALLLVLFRVNPGELFRSVSDQGEKLRQKKQQRARERAAQQAEQEEAPQQPVYQDQPPQQQEAAPQPRNYYQPAPIYNTTPVYPPAQPDEQGFYPVQPELYDERFPLHGGRSDETPPQAQERPAVPDQASGGKTSMLDRIRRLSQSLTARQQEDAPPSVPARQEPRPTPVQPRMDAPRGGVAKTPVRQTPVQQPAQALDDPEDLPWEEPAPAPRHAQKRHPAPAEEEPVSRPAPVREQTVPAPQQRPVAEPRHAAAAPAEKPPKQEGSTWAQQVRDREAQLNQPLPEHTAAKGDPKPVYTDPVMPITGEKVPIKPAPVMKEQQKDQRLDGTAKPAVVQEKMKLPIPYKAPPIRLLNEAEPVSLENAAQEDEIRGKIIERTLSSFGVDSEVRQILHGPSITRFAIQIAPGVKVSKVINTSDNLALELKTKHVRVEAPIQGTNYIGIEVPNQVVGKVSLREVLDSPEMRANPNPLVVALGKDITGSPVLCDLSKMPHLLIAGATGSGKSVCINSIVCSLLYRTSPEQVRLILVDPKQVELSVYNGIPHLLVPVVSDPRKAAGALSWVVQEMLERYSKFTAQSVRSIHGYNKANEGTDKMLPNIVVVIDEMADLMEVCRKDVEESIRRLAALARAAGIYMILATQRPSVDVITGVIKNNIPSRIAFSVSSGADSRTIIDIIGAEKLMGRGDMLYKPTGASPIRVQGCFVSDEEVNAISTNISSRYASDYDPDVMDHLENSEKEAAADEITSETDDLSANGGDGSFNGLLKKAIEMAIEDGQTSTSMLQRRLRVGYARAGRLIDEMEKRGIISHSEGSKPRKTLITRQEYDDMEDED